MPLSLWWKGVLSSPPAIDSPEQILLIREENREVTESLRSPVDDYPLDGVGLSVEGSLAGVVPLLKHTVTQKKKLNQGHHKRGYHGIHAALDMRYGIHSESQEN